MVFVPTWLSEGDQQALDESLLKNFEEMFYNTDSYDEESMEIDWEGLRTLANSLFIPTDTFLSLVRELLNKQRKNSIEFVDKQENQFDQDSIPYYPTVQYTERLRQKVIEIILMSLALDFLESPLAEDVEKLEDTLKNSSGHRFVITPLSLWRAYPILTTVSYGETKLKISKNGETDLSIDFGGFLDSYVGENKRVSKMIEYIKSERGIFKLTLEQIWNDYRDTIKNSSSSASIFKCFQNTNIQSQDIERILIAIKGE